MQQNATTPSVGETVPARQGSATALVFQVIALCVLIAVLNQLADLKDREAYRAFYASLDACEGFACLLITDNVRSPVFLSMIILAQRVGLDFNVAFTLISVASLCLFAKAMRQSQDPRSGTRFVLISLALGTWLYLIQVKLFVAVALYMYARTRSRKSLRIALAIAAVLTHESMLFFIALYYLWRPNRLNLKSAVLLVLFSAVLIAYLGAQSNVFMTAFERIQRYNEFSAQGVVPAMSRAGPFSAFLFLFGLIGLLRLKPSAITNVQLKAAAWMFFPWIVMMIFASNELFATRLAELAMLHALLVVPLGSHYLQPSRLALLAYALIFGALTFVRDVLLA